jgi:hypothetical protein
MLAVFITGQVYAEPAGQRLERGCPHHRWRSLVPVTGNCALVLSTKRRAVAEYLCPKRLVAQPFGNNKTNLSDDSEATMNIDRNPEYASATSGQSTPNFRLADTLGGYEVEEIDIHDLARFLSAVNPSAKEVTGKFLETR